MVVPGISGGYVFLEVNAVGDLIDLGDERRRREPPCPECGGSGPPDSVQDWAVLVGLGDYLAGLDDGDISWTQAPEQDPRVLGVLDLEEGTEASEQGHHTASERDLADGPGHLGRV